MKASEYFSQYKPGSFKPNGRAARNVATHFFLSLLWVVVALFSFMAGVIALGVDGLFLAMIAVPAGILAGASVRQALTSHPEWMLSEPSFRRILRLIRKCEKMLFWLGIIGSLAVIGVIHGLSVAPALLEYDTVSFVLHLSLHMTLLTITWMGTMFFMHMRLAWKYLSAASKAAHTPTDARRALVDSFLQEVEYRKN